MGRHRHAVNVRVDGVAAVLAAVLRDGQVRAAGLVDVGSGMILDHWDREGSCAEAEDLGAAYAELARALSHLPEPAPGRGGELLLSRDEVRHHVVRVVPDPFGDRLALAVVVHGPRRSAERARRRLQAVPVEALTAGPTLVRRPHGWWPLRSRPVPSSAPAAAPALPAAAPSPPSVPLVVPPARTASPGAAVPLPRRVPGRSAPRFGPAPVPPHRSAPAPPAALPPAAAPADGSLTGS